MELKQRIQDDMKASMREGAELATGVLRMLLASIAERQRVKRQQLWKTDPKLTEEQLQAQSALSDEEIQDVVASEVKKRNEAAGEFERGGREELAQKERAEAEILQTYLPKQLSEEELRQIVQEAIQATGASSVQDIGKVMGAVMPRVRGRAQGNDINRIAKELLGA